MRGYRKNPIDAGHAVLLGALLAGGITATVLVVSLLNEKKASASTGGWTRVSNLTILPNKVYRGSVIQTDQNSSPEMQTAARVVDDYLNMQANSANGTEKVWLPGETLPADWPAEDRDPTRRHFELQATSGLPPQGIVIPPTILDVRLYTK